MGQIVTTEHADKVARNRAEGRACGGPSRSRLGCETRAQYNVVTRSWTHRIDEGPSTERSLPMCTRHAKAAVSGPDGVNFRVLHAVKL